MSGALIELPSAIPNSSPNSGHGRVASPGGGSTQAASPQASVGANGNTGLDARPAIESASFSANWQAILASLEGQSGAEAPATSKGSEIGDRNPSLLNAASGGRASLPLAGEAKCGSVRDSHSQCQCIAQCLKRSLCPIGGQIGAPSADRGAESIPEFLVGEHSRVCNIRPLFQNERFAVFAPRAQLRRFRLLQSHARPIRCDRCELAATSNAPCRGSQHEPTVPIHWKQLPPSRFLYGFRLPNPFSGGLRPACAIDPACSLGFSGPRGCGTIRLSARRSEFAVNRWFRPSSPGRGKPDREFDRAQSSIHCGRLHGHRLSPGLCWR